MIICPYAILLVSNKHEHAKYTVWPYKDDLKSKTKYKYGKKYKKSFFFKIAFKHAFGDF